MYQSYLIYEKPIGAQKGNMKILIYSTIIIALILGLLTSKNMESLILKNVVITFTGLLVLNIVEGDRTMSIILLVLLSILFTWIGVVFAYDTINRTGKKCNMAVIWSIAIGFFVACISIGMIVLR